MDIFSVETKEESSSNPLPEAYEATAAEETLMELGSIVNTIDEELSLEMKLRTMLSEIIKKPLKEKRWKGKASSRINLNGLKSMPGMSGQYSDGDSLGSHHSSQLSSLRCRYFG